MKDNQPMFNRRDIFKAAGAVGLLGLLYYFLGRENTKTLIDATTAEWPTNEEAILARIRELHFPKNSHLRTSFCPRKTMWEEAKLAQRIGTWTGGDESDWLSHQKTIEEDIALLAEAGFRGARLVVFPFEVTQDGKTFDWSALDTAIHLMAKHNMRVDLSAGPLDYPFGPSGIRLPIVFENALKEAIDKRGKDHIYISQEEDPNYPDLSKTIRDYSLYYLQTLLEKYGNDPRISTFYLGNEWPDTHLIEGLDGATMSIGANLMQEFAHMLKRSTSLPIALNTNIPPYDPKRIHEFFAPIFYILEEQGTLGFDPYYTQEKIEIRFAKEIPRYGDHVKALQQDFPPTQFIFTELQAEPWPPGDLAGQEWERIFREHPELVHAYFLHDFPQSLEPYIINSGITEVGLWGSPAWPIFHKMGWKFPMRMFSTLAETMKRA